MSELRLHMKVYYICIHDVYNYICIIYLYSGQTSRQLPDSFRTASGQLLDSFAKFQIASRQLPDSFTISSILKFSQKSEQLPDSFRTASGQLPDSFRTASRQLLKISDSF